MNVYNGRHQPRPRANVRNSSLCRTVTREAKHSEQETDGANIRLTSKARVVIVSSEHLLSRAEIMSVTAEDSNHHDQDTSNLLSRV